MERPTAVARVTLTGPSFAIIFPDRFQAVRDRPSNELPLLIPPLQQLPFGMDIQSNKA